MDVKLGTLLSMVIHNYWLYENMKYKNYFSKGYTPNWSGKVFVIKKVKDNVLWAYVIDLNVEEIVRLFYEKVLKERKRESPKRIQVRKNDKKRH